MRVPARDRTPVACRHDQADHQHGTWLAYKLDLCGCPPCSTAMTVHLRAETYRTANGLSHYVDAGQVREHLRTLQAAGLGLRRIQERSGVGRSTLQALVGNVPGRPRRTVHKDTAARLLAITVPTATALAEGIVVDGTGARRRVQALMCLGWSTPAIAAHAGLDRQALDRVLRGGRVLARTAQRIIATYDALWNRQPNTSTPARAIAVGKTRRRAQAAGWAPPLAWDDDTIDDPAASLDPAAIAPDDAPDLVAVDFVVDGCRMALPREERLLVVTRLVAKRLSDAEIASRCGVTARTVLRDRQHLGLEPGWTPDS